MPEDVPLPVQSTPDPASGVVAIQLCFTRGVHVCIAHLGPGDRVLDHTKQTWFDPLRCITWPELYPTWALANGEMARVHSR